MIKYILFFCIFLVSTMVSGRELEDRISFELKTAKEVLEFERSTKKLSAEDEKNLEVMVFVLEIAPAICIVESKCENVIGDSKEDYGYFQLHKYTLEHFFEDPNITKTIMERVDLQLMVYRVLMQQKFGLYGERYPKTWFCTYHSATPEFMDKYCKRLLPLIKGVKIP